MQNFIPLNFTTGKIFDLSNDEYPANLYAFDSTSEVTLSSPKGSFFGFVFENEIHLQTTLGTFTLKEGMYFSIAEEAVITGDGKAIIIEQKDHNAFFHIGGPIENKGRLTYIDGCTDSLLISPPVMGNPCLNLLQIPKGTFQSQHTHPSFRIGIVVKGYGTCVTPTETFPLTAGQIFVIPKDAYHSFTTENDDLLVVAYHPDSDFGPTHENHPMINRTVNVIQNTQ
ncbi:MAG: cupin domain-containing protein [Cytophagales bacterium]|nr:cupin domain-containing protein [Cytophagales bacterium]